jgi:hypothetical protein
MAAALSSHEEGRGAAHKYFLITMMRTLILHLGCVRMKIDLVFSEMEWDRSDCRGGGGQQCLCSIVNC